MPEGPERDAAIDRIKRNRRGKERVIAERAVRAGTERHESSRSTTSARPLRRQGTRPQTFLLSLDDDLLGI